MLTFGRIKVCPEKIELRSLKQEEARAAANFKRGTALSPLVASFISVSGGALGDGLVKSRAVRGKGGMHGQKQRRQHEEGVSKNRYLRWLPHSFSVKGPDSNFERKLGNDSAI